MEVDGDFEVIRVAINPFLNGFDLRVQSLGHGIARPRQTARSLWCQASSQLMRSKAAAFLMGTSKNLPH